MPNKQSSQFPYGVPFIDSRNNIDYRWAAVLNNLTKTIPIPGTGFVVDGSNVTYGQMILFQGLDSDKGAPDLGNIYFALDSGITYYGNGSTWNEFSAPLIGDITKPANSNVTTLPNVNFAPGTWGTPTLVPIITVNAKGQVTNVITEPILVPTPPAAGSSGQIQFNTGGNLDASSGLTFNRVTNTLNSVNELLTGNLNVLGSATLSGNRYPTITGTSGQFLETDGAGNLSWGTVTAGSTQTPFHILLGDTFTVDINSQVLIAEPIIVDGTLTIIGDLISVPSSAPPAGVTSIDVSGGTSGLITTGGPITTSGTITIGGILALTNGGTGTSTPNLTSGSGISITGTWPDQTIAAGGGGGGDPALFWSSV